jgi:hypothetical protein
MPRFCKQFGWILIAMTAVVGCAEDEQELSVEQKCDALAAAVCDRYTQCGATLFKSQAEANSFASACEPQARVMLECPAAVEVSASYPDCIQDLATAACVINVGENGFSPGAEVPASCEQVVSLL